MAKQIDEDCAVNMGNPTRASERFGTHHFLEEFNFFCWGWFFHADSANLYLTSNILLAVSLR